MTTECTQFVFGFHPQKRRKIRAQFDGGGLLLREVEKRIGILRKFAACFTDYRNPDLIEHRVEEMVAQRVYGLALGYEDLNDHEELRNDPLLAGLVEKGSRGRQVLAGKSTLNRLELTQETASRNPRSPPGGAERNHPGPGCYRRSFTRKPGGWFFHGYYGHDCYPPLYIFCGEVLLGARLRPSNIDAAAGSVEELKSIVAQIRSAWSQVRIVVRGEIRDSAARNCWPGVKPKAWTICLDWRKTSV
jgi:Transposase DDE domain group 1